MVAVEEEQVLGLILTKTPETLVGLVEVVAVELASLQVMEVHKIQVVMVLLEVILHLLREDNLVLTHLLTLVEMVAVVVHMEKEEDKQDLVETEEIEMMVHKVVLQEVQTEVEEVQQEVMDMV